MFSSIDKTFLHYNIQQLPRVGKFRYSKLLKTLLNSSIDVMIWFSNLDIPEENGIDKVIVFFSLTVSDVFTLNSLDVE